MYIYIYNVDVQVHRNMRPYVRALPTDPENDSWRLRNRRGASETPRRRLTQMVHSNVIYVAGVSF